MVEAWQTLWEIVDSSHNSSDCKKMRKLFLNGGGLTLFLKCMKKFPNNATLIETMLGCLSEVVLEDNLRHKMMTQDFASQIIALSDTPAYTDLSGCAIETLCHMLNDGSTSWKKTKTGFSDTLTTVRAIFGRWKPEDAISTLGIDNFDNLFKFLESDIPEMQLHGLWSIALFTRQRNSKFSKYLKLQEINSKSRSLLVLHTVGNTLVAKIGTMNY